MKLVEPILPQGTKVKIGEGPCYHSMRLELSESNSSHVGEERYVKSAWLADDGKIYYWLAVNESPDASLASLLAPSSNLERVK